MPALSDRIENVLNESRMLLLGGQVLLGFAYRICFEPAFAKLPYAGQAVEVTALAVMTLGLSCLIWPAAFHQIADHGRQTERIHSFTTRVLDWALFPFCLGLGLSFYPVSLALHVPQPFWISLAVGVLATFAWYSPLALRRDKAHERRTHLVQGMQKEEPQQPGDLDQRIKKVLIECRMGLPGAQAFLGFQFAIVFTEGFAKLPRSSQWIHFASLVSMTLAILFLIAPAAYHRLAEAGEDTERFHTVASYLLLGGIAFLAPGMSGDLYVVLRQISGSVALSAVFAGGLGLACYLLWFAFSFWKRRPERFT